MWGRVVEQLVQLMKPEILLIVYSLLLFTVLLYKGKLPSIRSVADLANLVNSRGGNILVLSGFTLFFFIVAIRFFYHAIDIIHEGKLSPDNAVLGLGISFVSGTAFGSFAGALLKTMTGEDVKTINTLPDNTDNKATSTPKIEG